MGKPKSPWESSHRAYKLIWQFVWGFFCHLTPKPFNPWRLFVLKCFGCRISGTPFVHQTAKIENPKNLEIEDRACIGANAVIYSLDKICIGKNSIVAQESYLCSGTHEFESGKFDLITKPIVIEENVFVGARAFIMPGITLGKDSIIGACSVVTKSVDPGKKVAGNPAKRIA